MIFFELFNWLRADPKYSAPFAEMLLLEINKQIYVFIYYLKKNII